MATRLCSISVSRSFHGYSVVLHFCVSFLPYYLCLFFIMCSLIFNFHIPSCPACLFIIFCFTLLPLCKQLLYLLSACSLYVGDLFRLFPTYLSQLVIPIQTYLR